MKIVIYGLGRRYKNSIDRFNDDDVIAVSDLNNNFGMKWKMSIPFVHVEDINRLEFDYIVVTPKDFFEEISASMILKYGINPQKIISLDYYLKRKSADKRCYFQDVHYYIQKVLHNTISARFYFDSATTYLPCLSQMESKSNTFNIRGDIIGYESNVITSIFVVTHKAGSKINNSTYKYIAVGENSSSLQCDLTDNTGDNISKYNNLINECTALYWIWKNDDSSIVGLNHYRRFFESPINEGWPIQSVEAEMLLEKHDVIVARHIICDKETVLATMKYDVDDRAHDRAFPLVRDIFCKIHPNERVFFDDMLYGNIVFPCEMFIMRRELLEEYCSWLFPIVFEMLRQIRIDDEWDEHSKRIIGFWIERLLTVWLLSTDYTICELPILFCHEGS